LRSFPIDLFQGLIDVDGQNLFSSLSRCKGFRLKQ